MDAQEIVQRVDLIELVKAAGGRVHEKPDGTGSSNCPLHNGNSTRSFSIYRGRDGQQRWYCWSRCHTGGDAIQFVMHWKKLDFRQSMCELEHWIGTVPEVTKEQHAVVSTEPQPPSAAWQDRAQAYVCWAQDQLWGTDGERGMNYLVNRGLEERTIGMFMLGWIPATWQDLPEKWGLTGKPVTIPKGVIIPCWREGLWYVKARQMGGGPKYLSVRGGTNTMFGVDRMQRDSRPLLIVEGEFDAMVGWQECADFVDVVAMPGAGQRLSMADMMMLTTRRRILACLDDDEAGKAGLRYLQSISSAVEPVATPGGCHDLNDALLAGVNLAAWVKQL